MYSCMQKCRAPYAKLNVLLTLEENKTSAVIFPSNISAELLYTL